MCLLHGLCYKLQCVMYESGIEIGVEDISISRFYIVIVIKEKFDCCKYQICDFIYRHLISVKNFVVVV